MNLRKDNFSGLLTGATLTANFNKLSVNINLIVCQNKVILDYLAD